MTEPGTDQVSGRYSSPPGTRVVGKERPVGTGRAALTPTASRIAKTESAGPALVRAADRLGKTVDELTRNIPPDTLRRTRYPVREQAQPDGTTLYEHDLGVVESRHASVRP